MHRWIRNIFVLLLTLGLLMAIPAVTAADEPDEEFRINLLAGDPTMAPADTPFFIFHGWGPAPAETNAIGQMGFALEIDGVDQGKGKFFNFGTGGFGSLTRVWLYEYPDGLPQGSYVFTGYWSLPCSEAVDDGFIPGPCERPNEPVDVIVAPLTVTFS